MKNILKNVIIKYLKDAGFIKKDYYLDGKEKKYVEVYFNSSDAVYFIIEDILKSEYKNILEIKDYKYGNGVVTAIITFYD